MYADTNNKLTDCVGEPHGSAQVLILQHSPAPLIFLHLYPSVFSEFHTFRPQELDLSVPAAEGKGFRYLTVAVHNSVARDDARFGIDMERIAHHPCKARISHKKCYLSIGCNLAAGDHSDVFIYFFKPVHRF